MPSMLRDGERTMYSDATSSTGLRPRSGSTCNASSCVSVAFAELRYIFALLVVSVCQAVA